MLKIIRPFFVMSVIPGFYKVQQNKHSKLQHFEKRKGFLELYRVFQGCFSLLKIKQIRSLNNNSW